MIIPQIVLLMILLTWKLKFSFEGGIPFYLNDRLYWRTYYILSIQNSSAVVIKIHSWCHHKFPGNNFHFQRVLPPWELSALEKIPTGRDTHTIIVQLRQTCRLNMYVDVYKCLFLPFLMWGFSEPLVWACWWKSWVPGSSSMALFLQCNNKLSFDKEA